MNKRQIARSLDCAERLCADRGVRLTRQRRAVLELICRSDKPIGAYEILDQLREQVTNPAPPTVYRALDFLLEQGLVHKLESLHAFIGCTHPEHPHASQFLICTDCGIVDEMDDHTIARGVESAERTSGFKTERPVVELLGTCADCALKK